MSSVIALATWRARRACRLCDPCKPVRPPLIGPGPSGLCRAGHAASAAQSRAAVPPIFSGTCDCTGYLSRFSVFLCPWRRKYIDWHGGSSSSGAGEGGIALETIDQSITRNRGPVFHFSAPNRNWARCGARGWTSHLEQASHQQSRPMLQMPIRYVPSSAVGEGKKKKKKQIEPPWVL